MFRFELLIFQGSQGGPLPVINRVITPRAVG